MCFVPTARCLSIIMSANGRCSAWCCTAKTRSSWATRAAEEPRRFWPAWPRPAAATRWIRSFTSRNCSCTCRRCSAPCPTRNYENRMALSTPGSPTSGNGRKLPDPSLWESPLLPPCLSTCTSRTAHVISVLNQLVSAVRFAGQISDSLAYSSSARAPSFAPRQPEYPFLQPLVPQHKAVPIPHQNLQSVSPARAKHKQMPAQRILPNHRLHPLRQPVKPAAHVRRFHRQPDARGLRPIERPQTRQPHHAASTTPTSTRTCSASQPRPTTRLRPFRNRISTRAGSDTLGSAENLPES